MNDDSEWLLRPSRLWTWPELQESRVLPPRMPGAYGWYFDGLPGAVPVSACHFLEGRALVYVGISSTQTLRTRLRTHFRGNAFGSTLRLTLGCLLAAELGLHLRRVGSRGTRLTFGEGERQLSEWMDEHARVVFVEHPRPRDLEARLLCQLKLPLNLDGNEAHPFHPVLFDLRARHRAESRAGGSGQG